MAKLLKWTGYLLGVIVIIYGFYIMTELRVGDSKYSDPHPYRTSIGWAIVLSGFLHTLLFVSISRIYQATVKA